MTNWPVYEAGLRQRGSLTFWVSDDVLAFCRKTPGCQPRFSDLAVQAALQLGLVFKVALRQVEGLVASLLQLMGVDLLAPDYTILSRRCGQSQICRNRHDDKSSIGNRLRTRKIDNQQVEAALACDALNRMRAAARPNCVRITQMAA